MREINIRTGNQIQFMEPTATATGVSIGVKLGFAWIISAIPAAIITMAVTQPKTKTEWIAGLTSTVMGSIFAGSLIIQHYGLASWINDGPTGLMAIAGIIFLSGLPFWLLVRGMFKYFEGGKNLIEFIKDAKAAWKS